jgi:predicted transposase YbfD/YdcC
MAPTVHVSLDQVIEHFQDLKDPRSPINQKHPLVSVVVISLMGVLAGCGGPTAIAEWAEQKRDFLLKALDLPNGIPRKDVFRRVLCSLKPDAFQACFVAWLQALKEAASAETGIAQPIYAVDGKTLRRSHNKQKGLGPLHSVSVWASEFGLTLGQVATEEKSNEITAIPELLKLVDISGAIITIDAMGTQTKIAKEIIDGGGDYVLQLKGNQEKAHQHVMDYVEKQIENDFADVKARKHVTTERGHGRQETRTYIQMPVPKDLPGFSRWKGLKTIGVVLLVCLRDGKETYDIRYYLSSLQMGVKRFARAARGHWGIENNCHWVLDMAYREDESRVRDVKMRENIAWLNRFSLSLLKQHPGKQSIVMKRRCCAWNEEFMMEVLTGERT